MGKEEIGLGVMARDRISGFEGVVNSISYFANGCIRVALAPRELKDDGSPREDGYFDIQQIEYVGPGVSKEPWVVAAPTAEFATAVLEPVRTGGPAREGDPGLRVPKS